MRYNKNSAYWIFLQKVIGYGSNKILPIVRQFRSIQDFYDCSPNEMRQTGLLTKSQMEKFIRTDLSECREVMSRCNELGYKIITPNDVEYPKRLNCMTNPPAVLYVKGEMPDFDNEVVIAVVGTRQCDENGEMIARRLSHALTKAGALVISGCATGIDTSAHMGALSAGGKTCALLGCGINFPYLMKNQQLREDISEHGALISEFPPDVPASRFTFPVRNRLMSGLALGVLVVEATERSGSLITADHALDQGKDIFVVPGDISDPLYIGSNSLIRDGATVVTDVADILNEYNDLYPHKLDLTKTDVTDDALFDPKTDEVEYEIDFSGLSNNARLLYNMFEKTDRQYLDDIVASGEIPSSDAIAALTELEIYGYVKALPGGRYILSSK